MTELATQNLNIRGVPVWVHRALKAKAALEGKSLQELLVEILTQAVMIEQEVSDGQRNS